MKVLIVTAHPATEGFTHKIAKQYAQDKTDAGDDVFIMNLYKKKYAQPFLYFEYDQKGEHLTVRGQKMIQEHITKADEIVFVFPIWWFGPPAILKNFLDQNFTAGFAYKYNKEGVRKELLEGKSARIFVTADGPWWVYFVFRISIYVRWSQGVLGFCGITLHSLDIFSDMVKRRDDASRRAILQKVSYRARR